MLSGHGRFEAPERLRAVAGLGLARGGPPAHASSPTASSSCSAAADAPPTCPAATPTAFAIPSRPGPSSRTPANSTSSTCSATPAPRWCELTANALRDWCRFSGTGSSYIEPGAPWENPFVESFNGRLRDEFLAVEQFDSLLEAQVLIEDWRIEYNTKRPHSSLGWLAPATYAERWEAQQHAGLS